MLECFRDGLDGDGEVGGENAAAESVGGFLFFRCIIFPSVDAAFGRGGTSVSNKNGRPPGRRPILPGDVGVVVGGRVFCFP